MAALRHNNLKVRYALPAPCSNPSQLVPLVHCRAAAAAEARVALAESRCTEAASELQRLLSHTDAAQQTVQVCPAP